MNSLLYMLLLVPSFGLAKICTPKALGNGGFETGKFAPWTSANEYEGGLPALTITTTAYDSKYAANMSLIYRPTDKKNKHDEQRAPLINILQAVNACSVPQTFSLRYNVQPHPIPAYTSEFNPFIYDSITHEVYANAEVHYNSSSGGVDSLGNKFGEWHELGPFHFTPHNNTLIVTLVTSGAYGKTHGTATILVDDIQLYDTGIPR